MATKKESDLTLSDRLSRLSYSEACKVLGPRGKSLLDRGGQAQRLGLRK